MMDRPRFSIVIPTRDRAETLEFALRTCLRQTYDHYEVIVADNCSPSSTKEVVERQRDPRIRYVRSDVPLAMSDNWEKAVSQSEGEFVIVLGDDDGLMPYALKEIDELLLVLQVKALRWERIYYGWPSLPIPNAANRVDIPMVGTIRIVRGRRIISRVARFAIDYTALPMLYNSAIHRDLISELKARTGRVFSAQCPDIYSGFAFAYLAGKYASVSRPMTINGGSPKSNGVATMHVGPSSPIAAEFHDLNLRAGLAHYPTIPRIEVLPAYIADAFFRARERLFPGDTSLHLDRRVLTEKCISAIGIMAGEEWQQAFDTIRSALSDDRGLVAWFERRFSQFAPREQPVPLPPTQQDSGWANGFNGFWLSLDASDFGVSDVDGVAVLCSRLLGRSLAQPDESVQRMTDWKAQFAVRLRLAARMLVRGY